MLFELHQFLELLDEPRVDLGQREQLLGRHPQPDGIGHLPQSLGQGGAQRVAKQLEDGLAILAA